MEHDDIREEQAAQKQYAAALEVAKAEYNMIEPIVVRAHWLRRTIEDLSQLVNEPVESRYKDLNEVVSTFRGKRKGKSFVIETTRGEQLHGMKK